MRFNFCKDSSPHTNKRYNIIFFSVLESPNVEVKDIKSSGPRQMESRDEVPERYNVRSTKDPNGKVVPN